MRLLPIISALFFGIVTAAMAETPILSAPDAEAQMESGDLVLLDIRTPQEWAETGVAKGAWPVSMHDPSFGTTLQTILGHVSPDRIALICATGGRTAYVTNVLQQNGINGVADVSEGMMGNGRAPGWIARGLPVVTADEAADVYENATDGW